MNSLGHVWFKVVSAKSGNKMPKSDLNIKQRHKLSLLKRMKYLYERMKRIDERRTKLYNEYYKLWVEVDKNEGKIPA